ncbi:trans-aconitate 2-methyltransferase [Silvimonas sp. JCM 19000]
MTWSARQYSAFEAERTRPVRDLVAAIPPLEVRRAVDLGCGPANSTEVLAERFPAAHIVGIDSSDDMLRAARQRLPNAHFELADIADWHAAAAVDVILANASLQWLPDHATLYPRLLQQLQPGGVLAIQTPDNLDEPAHVLMREVAAAGPWADRIAAAQQRPRHDARFYHELLRPYCRNVDIWRTTYYHALPGGPAAIVDWFKSTGLRPFLAPLTPDEQAVYLARYLAAITQAYPALADGSVLLPFPRLFIVAQRI